jgi:hypothetical protein
MWVSLSGSDGTRQFEQVLGDKKENQVGRDKGYLVQTSLSELALVVALRGEAEATMSL